MNTMNTIITNSFVGAMKSAVATQPKVAKVKERVASSDRGAKKRWLAAYFRANPEMIHNRKGAMAAFMNHFDGQNGNLFVSPACASTFVANFRSGEWTFKEEAK